MLYKQIVLEWGRDTETGVWGKGYSPDNGEHFYVTDTTFGRKYRQNDVDGLWNNGMHEKVKEKVNQEITNTVEPAIKQADSAVAYANDAIEKSRVNSQAIVDINSAVSDAVSDAAVARSDGLRAWNAAQSNVDLIDLNYASASAAISSARTEAIAAADEAKASASAAQADIVAVRSDVAAVQADVTATRSDVAVAKSDIADTKTSLTSQAKSLSSYASQASAAGKEITTLKSQAGQFEQDMADTKGDVSQLKVSASSASVALSDAAGNISSLQATAKSYSAALSDAKGDIATVKATASELETKYADAAGDINKLQTDASGTKQTLTNAKSDIAVLQSRADGFDTKYANVAGDVNTLKNDATGFQQTLTDAKGNISTLQATATGLKNTLTDAQGNISTLQSDVARLKKTTSDHAGNIATLQADAKTLTSQMSSVQGDISTLNQTASGTSSKVSGMETSLANANSKINDITSNGGGRNLLNGTSDVWTTLTASGWMIVTTADSNKTSVADYHVGDKFTYSATVTNKSNTNVRLELYRCDKNGNRLAYNVHSDSVAPNTTAKRISCTISIDENTWFVEHTLIADGGTSDSKTVQIKGEMFEYGTIAHDWQPAPEDTDAKITTNTTAIDQNKKAIALKADQTTVDKTNGDVAQLKSQFKIQADQISGKVSSSDLDAKGYATQTYTQTLVKQTADTWNLNLTNVKNDEVKDVANLNASIDGIKADVYNKDGSSKITQLSNLIATKVSSGDYNSQITQLKNDINLRVQKGNVVSQINQEAGGNTLIQVANGKGSLILNADTVDFTGTAFIPAAYITDLTADKIKTGTLTGSTVHLDDGNGNTIDLGALSTDYVGFHSKATNGDQTYINRNGIHNYGATYDTKISQGMITTNLLAVNGGGLIDFRSSGSGITIDSQNIKFYNSNAVNGGIEFSGGSPLATVRNGTVGNELRVRYDRSFALTPITDESARICASSAAMQVGFIQSGSSTPDRQTTGL